MTGAQAILEQFLLAFRLGALAGDKDGAGGAGQRGSRSSDGLVPVDSALGRHRRTAMRLNLPAERCWVGEGIQHLDLLSDPLVYRKLLGALG